MPKRLYKYPNNIPLPSNISNSIMNVYKLYFGFNQLTNQGKIIKEIKSTSNFYGHNRVRRIFAFCK